MNHLSTEDINLANHTQIYEHFAEVELWPRATKFGRFVVSQCYKPFVHMHEGTRGHIADKLHQGSPLIFAPNHVRYIDHLVGFAALDSQFSVGNTNILGKVPYFQSPVMRALSEPFGTLPVWRKKDLPDNPSAEQLRQFAEAGIELLDVVAGKMMQGNNVFGFPEGTRNDKERFDEKGEDKWLRVMKLQQGIAKIAFNAWTKHDLDAAIVPLGIYYTPAEKYNWRRPHVYVGDLIVRQHDARQNSIPAVTHQLQQSIQYSVLSARDYALKNAA